MDEVKDGVEDPELKEESTGDEVVAAMPHDACCWY